MEFLHNWFSPFETWVLMFNIINVAIYVWKEKLFASWTNLNINLLGWFFRFLIIFGWFNNYSL